MDETKQLIENQKNNLPAELIKAIETTPWEPSLQKIGVESNLTADQIEILKRETMLVLYGFENPINFTENIAREAGVTEMIATNISDLIWQRVMEPISQIAEGNEGKELESAAAIPKIIQDIHPMIESGEVVHDVSHVEVNNELGVKNNEIKEEKPELQVKKTLADQPKKEKASLPDYRYPNGTDPYREPLN